MQISPTWIISGIGIIIAATTLGWRIGKNGSKAHAEIYKEVKNKVEITECHRAQDSIGKNIDDTRKHLSDKIDMTIKLLEKNGKS